MAPRTSWKGFLKLSLVSVPVRGFTAHAAADEIRLNQLHADCHGRVRYKKVCAEHGELKSEDIVSGYEYAKDSYVVIQPDEIAALRKASDKSVDIKGFVPPDAVDPIYFAGKNYYLLPDGLAGDRPYALLHDGMVEAGVCAIAQLVLAGREQLAMLRPEDGLLTLAMLHFAHKVKARTPFKDEAPSADAGREERKLTKTLIEASRIEDFDLTAFTDPYVENLGKLIQMKIDGQEVVQAPDPEEPRILDLMDALKKSVAEAETSAAGRGRKMAPSAKKTRKKSATKKTGAKKRKKTG